MPDFEPRGPNLFPIFGRNHHKKPLSAESVDNPRLGGVIRRHLHLDPVSDHQTNEALPHLPGNMRKQLVAAGQFHFEHCSGKHRGNGTVHLYRFFLTIGGRVFTTTFKVITTATAASATSTSSTTLFRGSWNKSKITLIQKPRRPQRRDHPRFTLLRNRKLIISKEPPITPMSEAACCLHSNQNPQLIQNPAGASTRSQTLPGPISTKPLKTATFHPDFIAP